MRKPKVMREVSKKSDKYTPIPVLVEDRSNHLPPMLTNVPEKYQELTVLSFTSPESSHILGASYNALGQYLLVMFKAKDKPEGQTYLYLNVPSAVWLAFEAAPSKGKFFNAHIEHVYTSFKKMSDGQ